MNVVIFTDNDAKTLIAHQDGQHRLSPVQLTDGRWFLLEDILTEIPEGLFKDKLTVPYAVEPFASIRPFIPAPLDEFMQGGRPGLTQQT
jgi:hypothetical protein